MDKTTVFKFATLRNAADVVTTLPELIVQPASPLVSGLMAINQKAESGAVRLAKLNAELQAFIDSDAFIRTRSAFEASQSQTGTVDYYERLYDNVVARTITGSNTNRVYKLVVDQLKAEHLSTRAGALGDTLPKKVRIVVPDGLIFEGGNASPATPTTTTGASDVVGMYGRYAHLRDLLDEARRENVLQFQPDGHVAVPNAEYGAVSDAFGGGALTVEQARGKIGAEMRRLEAMGLEEGPIRTAHEYMNRLGEILKDAEAKKITTLDSTRVVEGGKYSAIAEMLGRTALTIDAAERLVSRQLHVLSSQLLEMAPFATYAQIGDKWVDTTVFREPTESSSTVTDTGIMVYSHGCWLKFPFQIADLRIVEQQTVGYLPGEIAHINNIQPGEKTRRVTRRLKRTEEFTSLETEDEVMHESDTQSTEKFALEKEASQVQAEESSWNVNASVSGTYGPVTASVDAGYDSSTSATNANSASQSYAKEIVQKVVDRVSSKVKRERSTMTIEEFEETVTHVVDSTELDGPKSYVYRWLNKLSRATLKNYGKRLIVQIDVAHPSHYYVARAAREQPTVKLPSDPRTLTIAGIKMDQPGHVSRENYLALGDLYRVKLEAPPPATLAVSKGFASKGGVRKVESLTIPKGYGAVRGKYNGTSWGQNFLMFIASSAWDYQWWSTPERLIWWVSGGIGAHEFTFSSGNGLLITDNVDIAFWSEVDFVMNFEIECRLTEEAFGAWQVKTYQAVTEAYDNLQSEAQGRMNGFDPDLPGLNPQQKLDIIRTELKKEALGRMFRCNGFGISDTYVVGHEYHRDCCRDGSNGEMARFLETAFDWKNLTYEFFPYFYGSRDVRDDNGVKVSDNWTEIQKLSDSDPHFEAFLRASYATVRIPVFRDSAKELAAINFLFNNSIANVEVVPEGAQPLLDELENEPVSPFITYDIDGNELSAKETIELGVFPLPTSLVILECGVQNGVRPRGFPESPDDPSTDVSIARQYSPAIIADTCPD